MSRQFSRNCIAQAVRFCRRRAGMAGAVTSVIAVGFAAAPAAAQMPLPSPSLVGPPDITSAIATAKTSEDNLPIATDARLAGDDKQTRLILDLSRKIDLRAFTLADPYRVVVDLPQVMFRLPSQIGEHGRGLVKMFRYGLVMPGGSRIVIDTTGPVRVMRAFVLDPADGQPARLVVDLAPVDRETFLRAVDVDNRMPRAADPALAHHDPRPGDSRPLIVLDPGHGGIDSGTHAPSGETEKNLVLEFATMLRDKLERTGKFRVAMTRGDDTFVELAERVRFARLRQAQLFISIHCDALARGDGDAEGASVYTLSEHASDAEAQRLADAENRADIIAGVNLSAESSEVADILIDLAQRETKSFSTHFARAVVSELHTAARLHKHPLKSAGFRVLKSPDVPSVLIELGYVSNSGDLKQLTSEAWRSRTGDALVHAVQSYFATRAGGTRSTVVGSGNGAQ